jgi:hypothetical protein
MEVYLEEQTPVSVETVINDLEALIKRKEDASPVDLEEYQKNLQKIQTITNNHTSASLLNTLPEEIVLRILQLHDRAQKLSWNKLAAKFRSLAVLSGEKQSHDVITQILEVLVDNSVIHEEVTFESLLIGSSFDIVKWIKKGGNLPRLANYLQHFRITRLALEILHFVMTRSELTEIIASELSVPIMDIYLRLTRHKSAAFTLSIWQSFNDPAYFGLIKQLSPGIKLDWIVFIAQHYDAQNFEEKYLDLFTSLIKSVDISLLPSAFRPGQLLNEHFFVKIMRDNKQKTFDLLMQAGYNFTTFKKKGRALNAAIQMHRNYFVKEILKRKLLKMDEFELQDKRDLLVMGDLKIYQMMHAQGFDFTKSPLAPHTDVHVDYPFMNALMDWHLSKCYQVVPSLKRLCIIEVQANKISDERLPHDIRDYIAEYNEPWYWLNWNEDEANKTYWKELVQYLQATAQKVNMGIVEFKLKTVSEDHMTIRVDISQGFSSSFYRPTVSLPADYRNVQKGVISRTTDYQAVAEHLGYTHGDVVMLMALMSLVTLKIYSGGVVKTDQPIWVIYNTFTDLRSVKWFVKFLQVLVSW